MSSPTVPFSIAQPFQNIRLLEVPDELLEIIASRQSVRLVSEPAGESQSVTASSFDSSLTSSLCSKQGFLHVCTDEKVWTVRQVSTSNSLYIARTVRGDISTTTARSHEEGTGNDGSGSWNHGVGLIAFAKPTSLLELQEKTSDCPEVAARYLDRMIPLWPASSLAVDSPTKTPAYTSTRSILDDVPCSVAAVRKAISLAPLFRTASGVFHIPTRVFLLETWTKIIELATILDLSLTHDTLIGNEKFWVHLRSDIGEEGVELAKQILKPKDGLLRALKLMAGDSSKDSHGKDGNNSDTPITRPTTIYDERGIARWTARLILQVQSHSHGHNTDAGATHPTVNQQPDSTTGMLVSQFMQKWHSTLPAAWTKNADLPLLEDFMQIQETDGGEVIVLLGGDIAGQAKQPQQSASGSTNTSRNGNSITNASANSTGKRKWHEKFAAQRDRNLKR